MKYILFFALPFLFISCDMKRKDKLSDDKEALENKYAQQRKEASKDTTTVQVIDEHYDFGKVTDGEKVEFSYRFVNIGKHAMVVESATASCGCTVPERPEAPIMPGDTGRIKVVFNSAGRPGKAEKNITVVANVSPEFPQLLLTGEVTNKD
jgi:hypothetical protein